MTPNILLPASPGRHPLILRRGVHALTALPSAMMVPSTRVLKSWLSCQAVPRKTASQALSLKYITVKTTAQILSCPYLFLPTGCLRCAGMSGTVTVISAPGKSLLCDALLVGNLLPNDLRLTR